MKRIEKTWVEISNRNLYSNYKILKSIVGDKRALYCVVKANAYGHGFDEVLTSLYSNGVRHFMVDDVEDAIFIKKKYKSANVLLAGYFSNSYIDEIASLGISFVVGNLQKLNSLVKVSFSNNARIHLKIETGFNRQGFQLSELKKVLKIIKRYASKFDLEGLYSHFAVSDEKAGEMFTKSQIKKFKQAVDLVGDFDLKPKYIHLASSGGLISYLNSWFNTVRIGILLYGMFPSSYSEKVFNKKWPNKELKPVLSWKTKIAQLKTINKGESVSYGCTWKAKKKTTIAVLPIGYYDGYDRKLSNEGMVIIKGKLAPVVGRVTMNMTVVDVSKIQNIKVDDEVILIGGTSSCTMSADSIADKIKTINYEITTRINSRIKRVVV